MTRRCGSLVRAGGAAAAAWHGVDELVFGGGVSILPSIDCAAADSESIMIMAGVANIMSTFSFFFQSARYVGLERLETT